MTLLMNIFLANIVCDNLDAWPQATQWTISVLHVFEIKLF